MRGKNQGADDNRTVGERSGRDLAAAAEVLRRWLQPRLDGAKDLVVEDLAWPQGAGMSNETVLFRARYLQDGRAVDRGLVLRIAPSQVQLFMDANLRQQFDLLQILHRGGHVKVAEPLWFEADASLLGAPFYVMERLHGRVPVSFPVYNTAGFLFDAAPRERETLWRSAMEQLCRVAVTPLEAVAGVLDDPARGPTGFDQQMTYWFESCRWAGGGHSEFMNQAEEWLRKHRPAGAESGLSWGDARIGNMMFADDFTVAGVMDWEQASLAGPLHDLAWWLCFDDMHSRNVGVTRLEGLGDRQQTLDLWRELTGREIRDLEWYEVFARYKLAVIVVRGQAMARNEKPGNNLNNNTFTRQMAAIMGVDQPKDGYLMQPQAAVGAA